MIPIRLYNKPHISEPSETGGFFHSDPNLGVRFLEWPSFRSYLDSRYVQESRRNAANGYAGVAADGFIDPGIMRAAIVPDGEVADDTALAALTVVSNDVGKRLVRVTATGINYIAKAVGTGADKWQVYYTSVTASETVQGAMEIANDTEALSETDDIRAMTSKKTSKLARAIAHEQLWALAKSKGYLRCDGATTNRGANTKLPTFAQPSGVNVFVANIWDLVPTSNPTSEAVICGFGPSTSMVGVNASTWTLAHGTGGQLLMRLNGSSDPTNNRLTYEIANWRSAYSGQRICWTITGASTDQWPKIYANGVEVTGWSVGVNTGTPPTSWLQNGGIYLQQGANFSAKDWKPGVLGLANLTASEVLDAYKTQTVPGTLGAKSGQVTNLYSGDSTDFIGGTVGNWVAVFSTVTNPGTYLNIVTSATYGGARCSSHTLVIGQTYEVEYVATLDAGTLLIADSNLNNYITGAPFGASVVQRQRFVAISAGQLYFRCSNSGATLTLDDVKLRKVGLIVNPTIQPNQSTGDRSGNGIGGYLVGNTPIPADPNTALIQCYVDMSAVANKQLLGADVFNDGSKWEIESIIVPNALGAATLSFGDGSTVDRYATSTALTAGQSKKFTIANSFPADSAKKGIYANITVAAAGVTEQPVLVRVRKIA